MKRRLVFLINLLQDVNILRPLALMAAAERDDEILFLVSEKFGGRDRSGLWQKELVTLRQETLGSVKLYATPFDAVIPLYGGEGLIIAASESNLSAHSETHDVMRAAPSTYVCITLQHGYECVGFLQNRDHNAAHGQGVRFAADIVAGWTPLDKQHSMAASQRPKYYQSGPTAFLPSRDVRTPVMAEGLICENLHSVRFNSSGKSRDSFMEMFVGFVSALNAAGKTIALRPHPGGKRGFSLGATGLDFQIADQPIYRLDLSSFLYGISPPSSVLIDMIAAGIPVAVWRDPDGIMDVDAYRGLPAVSLPGDVLEFRQKALHERSALLKRQEAFLREIDLPCESEDVARRFRALLNIGVSPVVPTTRQNILVVADPVSATQVISFERPVSLSDDHHLTMVSDSADWADGHAVDALLERSNASWMVLSRYTGDNGTSLIAGARRKGIPVIFHIDDDLLNVPQSLGPAKYARYNAPERLSALRFAMEASDLIYASTPELKRVLGEHGISTPIVAGDIYCASPGLIDRPRPNIPQVIGYMGTGGHSADLDMVLPVIYDLMGEFPDLRFETFGSIRPPKGLEVFGPRVRHHEGVGDYTGFLEKLASLGWTVGLAPLQDSSFNRCKADTKWVEYASAGIATVASDLPVYASACAGGAGLLASRKEEWASSIRSLITDHDLHTSTLRKAETRLADRYTSHRLMAQVKSVLKQAESLRTKQRDEDRERTFVEPL